MTEELTVSARGPSAVAVDGRELPWLSAHFSRLQAAQRDGHLAHGLLISGPAGIGKVALAGALARAWLCEAPSGERPCGRCRGCRLSAAGTHPDLHLLLPEEGKVAIAVDQVRALIESFALQSHAGGSKVAVIAPAQTMTVAAQNSLLKTLEEPAGDAVLVLVSGLDGLLAPTIRSRCQRVGVQVPPGEVARNWLAAAGYAGAPGRDALALAGGAPLAALALLEDGFLQAAEQLAADLIEIAMGKAEPVEAAARWEQKVAHSTAVSWLQHTVHALLRAITVGESGTLAAPQGEVVARCAAHLDAVALIRYADELNGAVAALRGQANPRMLLEQLLIGWAAVTRPARTGARSR